MTTDEPIRFEIEVKTGDAGEDSLDKMTRNLLSELRETNYVSVNLVSSGVAPEGSKGDPVTIGMLALEVLPAAAPSLIALVQAWVMRGQGRTVKFKGKGFEFEGSPEEFEKFLSTFEKKRKKK
jgi:hypothetical protein